MIYKRALSGKTVMVFKDYSNYELHYKGSDYTIRNNNKIVKYLDGAYGHQECIDNALKWIKKHNK